MQFLSLSALALSAFISQAVANLDSTACSGLGACVSDGCGYYNGYDCGASGTITSQQAAEAYFIASSGLGGEAVAVTADEFPTSCDVSTVKPGSDSTLGKYTFDDSVFYFFINYSCGEAKSTVTDCYNYYWNSSLMYHCRFIKAGTTCSPIGSLTGTC